MSKVNCTTCNKEMNVFYGTYENQKHTCQDCRKAQLAKDLQNNEVTETECEDSIICPYCGFEHENICGYGEHKAFSVDGDHDFMCWECNKEFIVFTNLSISYSTERKE